NGYTGPLEVRLADRQARHLQGVTGPTLTIPATANDFTYPVTLPPWMETGRTARACVMALGTIKDGGVEHTVAFSSQAQNEQIIAVIETGRLGLELGKGSLPATVGKAIELPFTIRRGKGLTGAVKVELLLPEHVKGVTAAAVELKATESKGKLILRFAAK